MARQDELALVMTTETGKPFTEAKGEVAYAAEFFRWFSEEAVRIGGDMTTTGDGRNRILVTKEPVGPCVLVTPWNFPLAMGTRKIGPAIAADPDRAVEGAFAAKMRNMGEACTAVNRIFAQRSVAAEFSVRLAKRLDVLTVGDGALDRTDVGPLVEERR